MRFHSNEASDTIRYDDVSSSDEVRLLPQLFCGLGRHPPLPPSSPPSPPPPLPPPPPHTHTHTKTHEPTQWVRSMYCYVNNQWNNITFKKIETLLRAECTASLHIPFVLLFLSFIISFFFPTSLLQLRFYCLLLSLDLFLVLVVVSAVPCIVFFFASFWLKKCWNLSSLAKNSVYMDSLI